MKRGWTRHGHRIEGIEPFESPPEAIARCGGPAICQECAMDAAAAKVELTVGYPGQPQAEAAWVRHASEAIAEAIKGGANTVVFDVPTQHGEIVFDEAAHIAQQLIHGADEGEFGHPCDPIPCPPLEEHTLTFTPPGRMIADVRSEDNHIIVDVDLDALQADLRAELAEFKQWASDACELLHDIEGIDLLDDDRNQSVRDLLRRMENP